MPELDPIKTCTDQDGDIIMSDISPPSNFPKDKSIFDWFSFEGKTAPPKSPIYSPTSPNEKPNLSASTVSTSTYRLDGPIRVSEVKSRQLVSLQEPVPLKVKYPAPPPDALRWIWQCHLCSSRYPLAVTRRCLVDGHYYCSGNSQAQRNVKKRRRNQSCTSEFDYVAWKEWGQWKRKMMALKAFAEQKEEPDIVGCEGCSSPSQCRYEKRKRVETIRFDDFIDKDDLLVGERKETTVVSVATEEKAKSSKRIKVPSSEDDKHTKSTKLTSKKILKLESNSLSSALGQKSSGRHRFYSSMSISLSNRDRSPTSESLSMERGKFDPTLPSVTKAASKENEDLSAIEASLKATLSKQKQQTSFPSIASDSKSQTPPKTKRRLNTKKDDPQFAITVQDKPILSLQRTASQTNLLADFFRQSKSHSAIDSTSPRVSDQAAAEDDITAFLRSTPSWDIDDSSEVRPHVKRQLSVPGPVAANHVSHFEDIDLSGALASSATNTDGCGGSYDNDADAGGTQGQVQQVSGGNGGGSGGPAGIANASARGGLGFGLSFGFGRK